MSSEFRLTRRAALAGAAAAPFATGLTALPALAKSHSKMPPNATKHSFMLGDFQVTTLLSGSRTVEDPQSIFGMNVPAARFAEVSANNFIPADKAELFFTPTVVNTGKQVVLFDTGLNPNAITRALESAGYAPDDIDVVVVTHMHGDHIGGLADGAKLTFPNARYVAGQVEFNAWAKKQDDNFLKKIKPLAKKTKFIGDGDSVVSGITGMAAFGHTPGHMAFMLESKGQQLLIAADTANHHVWSLAFPDWEVKFDMDKEAAARTRKTIFGMLAADKIPFIGYHLPFPGVGYVDTRGKRFQYVPASYQLTL